MRALWITTALAFILTIGLPPEGAKADHHGAGPKVMQVFTIEHDANDRDALLARLKSLQGILSEEGLKPLRVWLGTYAGENTGRLFVTLEQDNYAGFGANQIKAQNSAAITKWVDDLNKAGISEVVSQSLLVEMTP